MPEEPWAGRESRENPCPSCATSPDGRRERQRPRDRLWSMRKGQREQLSPPRPGRPSSALAWRLTRRRRRRRPAMAMAMPRSPFLPGLATWLGVQGLVRWGPREAGPCWKRAGRFPTRLSALHGCSWGRRRLRRPPGFPGRGARLSGSPESRLSGSPETRKKATRARAGGRGPGSPREAGARPPCWRRSGKPGTRRSRTGPLAAFSPPAARGAERCLKRREA